MKRIIILTAALALLATACGKTLPDNSHTEDGYIADVRFSGEIVETKASIGGISTSGTGHPVAWSIGDQIWIYRQDGTAGAAFGADEATRRSTFSKKVWYNQSDYQKFVNNNVTTGVGANGNNGYNAFYPFIKVNYDEKSPEGLGSYPDYYGDKISYGFVFVTIPTVQTAVPGGANPRALVMSGKTDNVNDAFKFYNAVSLLELGFQAPVGYNVTSIEISTSAFGGERVLPDSGLSFGSYTATDNEAKTIGEIAGRRILYCADARSFINIKDTSKAAHSISLQNADKSPLTAGATYYASVWPGQKEGFKVILHATDAQGNKVTFTRSTTKNRLQFAKGVVYPLGIIGSTDAGSWQ